MSGLEVEANGAIVRAALDGDGWIVCQCEVGPLVAPGLVRGMDIRDSAHVVVHGRQEWSSLDSQGLRWLDQTLPVPSAVRVRLVPSMPAVTEPSRGPRIPPEQMRRLRLSMQQDAKRLVATRVKSALPPAPDLSAPVSLGRASICLRVVSAPTLQVLAGVPKGSAVAAVEFRRKGEHESVSIEIRGGSPAHPGALYFWAVRGPIATNEVLLSIEGEGQPDPPRVLQPDPNLAERYAQALLDMPAQELE